MNLFALTKFMITWLIDYLTNTSGIWTYVLVFVFVFLDASLFLGFILPGEAPVLVGGVLAGRGSISLWGIGLCVAAAAIAGDSFGYFFGSWIGRDRAVRWGKHFGVTDEKMSKAAEFFESHGGKAVFIGRFASVFRAFVPFIAGTTGMKYRRFIIYNAPAGFVWAIIFIGLGYWAGNEWRQIARWVDRAGWVFIIIVLIFFIAKWWKSR